MKRSEIAMIIFIASLSMMITFALVNSLLGDKIKRTATVEEASEISDAIEVPAKRVFSKQAINPTVEVCVESENGESEATTLECNSPATDEQDAIIPDAQQEAAIPADDNTN